MPDERLDDNAENALLEQMLGDARDRFARDVYGDSAKSSPLTPHDNLTRSGPKSTREALIEQIDAKVSAQVRELLRHPAVQQLEAAWRGLKYLVDHVDFEENVRVELVNCSKDELAEDFEAAVDVTVSGLYRRLCEPDLYTSDNAPFSLIVARYELDYHQQDMELIRHCAAVAADAHAPFIANASPSFFSGETFRAVAELGDLERVFQSPRYASWDSFRSSEDARYVALCAPRFLLRTPREGAEANDECLWGPATHAFGIRLAETFAKHRWFGGLASDIPEPGPRDDDEPPAAGQVEMALSQPQMRCMSANGFIALRDRRDGPPVPFSVNTTQRPKRFADTPEGRAMELNYRAGTDLPNILNICRVAHFVEALARELDVSQGAASLERVLQQWLVELVIEAIPSDAEVDRVKPFHEARIQVSAGDYFRYELEVRPRHEELDFTVWVAGTLGEVV